MVYELFSSTSLEDIKDRSVKKIENLFNDEIKLRMEATEEINKSKLSA